MYVVELFLYYLSSICLIIILIIGILSYSLHPLERVPLINVAKISFPCDAIFQINFN